MRGPYGHALTLGVRVLDAAEKVPPFRQTGDEIYGGARRSTAEFNYAPIQLCA